MIRIEHVTKCFKTADGPVRGLSDVSLELPNHGFVALCGENGCGKTTLLNLISTFLGDFEGNIFIDNLNVRENADFIQGRLVSYVLQEDCFIQSLTVNEALIVAKDSPESVAESLETFQIADKANKLPFELSGGQRQRVSFIRGALKECPVLLVDEPTSSMDEEMERFAFEKLREFSGTRLVILVSHDHTMIQNYCDIIVRLNDGRVETVEYNSPAEEIEYSDQTILFPGEVNFRAIDQKKADSILEKFGEIVIKVTTGKRKSFEGDFTPKVWTDTKVRKVPSKSQCSVVFRSMLKEAFKPLLSFVIAISILLLAVETMLDMRAFDAKRFVWDSIIGNGETLVSASQPRAFEKTPFPTVEELRALHTQYGTRIDIVENWEWWFSVECGYDAFFANYISGKSQSYFRPEDIIAGTAPKGNAAAITDYLAEALIRKNEEYSSYEDIFRKGLPLANYHQEICGIIRSGYMKYYEKYYAFQNQEMSEQDAYNFRMNRDNFYTMLFFDPDAEGLTQITSVSVEVNRCLADIVLDSSIKTGEGFINTALAEQLAYFETGQEVGHFHGSFFAVRVVDDGRSNPTFYLGENDFADCLNAEKNARQRINIELDREEELDFLFAKELEIESYTGTYVYDALNAVKLLQTIFYVLLLLFSAVLVLILRGRLKKIFAADTRLFVFQKLAGYRARDFFILEMGLIGIGVSGVSVLNLGLYYLTYWITNASLSGAFGISLNFLRNSISTYLLAATATILLSTFFGALCYRKRKRKEIVELLRR